MIRVSILWAGLAGIAGCAMSHDVGGDGTASTATALPAALARDKNCLKELEDSVSDLPDGLDCTGLYADMSTRELGSDVLPYEPALKLWSDGLNKARYIYLPKGTKIDASDPDSWKFPIGTRFWKEFQEPGTDVPVETRIYYKKDEGEWKQSTFEWNAAKTSAKRVTQAKDVTMSNGDLHWLPGPDDCEECHKGRRDRVLGFEQVAMALSDANGETLARLVADGLLKNFDGKTDYQIGPDEGSVDAKALGWLHMNCGVTCHNDNSNGTGQAVDMRLKLNADELDGRPTDSFPAVSTTIGADTQTLRWLGHTRIVAGSPADSWLYTLITQRGDMKQQMPPLATYVVDSDGSDWVKQWIEHLKAP